MSKRSDELAANVLASVYRPGGIVKSAGGLLVPVLVVEGLVSGFCQMLGNYDDHFDYAQTMLEAMNRPAGGPIMPGPGPGTWVAMDDARDWDTRLHHRGGKVNA